MGQQHKESKEKLMEINCYKFIAFLENYIIINLNTLTN